MASSAKTENIALNQWEATDPVLREDFNADNLIIDSVLKKSCRIDCGVFDGCADMRQSMDAIELDFVPKAVFLWQTGTANPWYTVTPITQGASSVICARVGSSETGVLYTSFLNETVAWSPSPGTADFDRNTAYRYLILG